MKSRLLFITFLFFISINVINAQSINVNSWEELKDAINSNYDEIVLTDEGSFIATSSITISGKELNIIPESNKNINISRGELTSTLMNVTNNSSVTIGSNEGMILFDNPNNVTSTGNYIYTEGSKLVTNKLTFKNNNSPTIDGSAILIKNSSTLIVNYSNFENNNGRYGGAIAANNTNNNVTINNSTFSGNSSASSGGAVYAYGTLTINNSVFNNNTAGSYGGAIMVKTNSVIKSSEITYNTATTNDGGGIRVDGNLLINDSTIKNNVAGNFGGGIDYANGTLEYNNCIITDNVADNKSSNINPDPNDERNIDWTKDETLKIEQINTDLIKVFEKDGTSGIPDFTGKYTQGFTIVKNFILFTIFKSNDDDTIIHIVDKDTFNLVNTLTFSNSGSNYNLGHANDLTYDKNTGYVYAYTYHKSSENKPIFAKFKIDDNGEAKDLEYFEGPKAASGLAFDSDHNRFIISLDKKIYVYNSNFELIKQFETNFTQTPQGIAYYKDHIYYSAYEAGVLNSFQEKYSLKEKGSNIIYVYDFDGKLVKSLYIPNTQEYGEIEALSFLDNGDILMSYNDQKIKFLKSTYMNEIKSISILNLPKYLDYKVGDKLNLQGLKLLVTYNDESSKELEDLNGVEISGFDSSKEGKQIITVKLGTKETYFEIEVLKTNKSIPAYTPSNDITNPKTGIKSYLALTVLIILISIIAIRKVNKHEKIFKKISI